MEKLKMESVSIAEDSLNKIAELFPNVVTESMGKDGQLHKAIDFDKLKFLLTANQAEMGAAARSAVSNQPGGLLLSLRFPTCRNVYLEADCPLSFLFYMAVSL